MLLQNQKFFEGSIGASLLNLLIALLILIIGYIVAQIITSNTRRLLKRIELDNRLVGALSELVERRDCQVEGVIPQLLKRIPNLGVFA
jgi:predicted PurR-regulated permease PerM